MASRSKASGNGFKTRGKIDKAYMLADPGAALKITRDGEKASITLPDKATDPIASVLALDMSDEQMKLGNSPFEFRAQKRALKSPVATSIIHPTIENNPTGAFDGQRECQRVYGREF